MLTEIAERDDVLDAHAEAMGGDFSGYRNHTYRVMNLCLALSPSGDRKKIALSSTTSAPWAPEIETTIREHHKLARHKPHRDWLVEPFRRPISSTCHAASSRFGLPRGLIKDMFAQWPSAGFHKRLVQLSLNRLVSHPLSPLPMVRL